MKKTLALIALLPTIFVSTTVFAQDFSAQIESRQNAFEQIESLSKQASGRGSTRRRSAVSRVRPS